MPDAHAPYHARGAWDLMLACAEVLRPTIVVVLGDLADCYCVSAHDRDPRRARDLATEIGAVERCLDDLDAIGAVRKIYIEGNHEARLTRYLAQKAPELVGMVDILSILDLRRRGWTWIPYRRAVRVGKIWCAHDAGFAGAYALRRSQAAYGYNLAIGHTHRIESLIVGDATGRPYVAMSCGWLGDPDRIDYAHRTQISRDWCHGVGVGYVLDGAGDTIIAPVPFVHGVAIVGGQIVTIAQKKSRKNK